MSPGYDVDLEYDATTPDGQTRFAVDPVEGVEPPEIVRLRLSLTNQSDEELRPAITSGAPPPFGILKLRGETGEFHLWSESYRSHDGVFTDGARITGRTKAEYMTHLQPGESVTETYSIRTDEHELRETGGLRAGEYEVVDANGRPIAIEREDRPIRVVVSESSG